MIVAPIFAKHQLTPWEESYLAIVLSQAWSQGQAQLTTIQGQQTSPQHVPLHQGGKLKQVLNSKGYFRSWQYCTCIHVLSYLQASTLQVQATTL